jgi:hypothetical protein
MPLPEIEYHENNGTTEEPDGYLYFTDGARLIFEPGTSGMGNPFGLFPGGWMFETDDHYRAAGEYLIANGLTGWQARS